MASRDDSEEGARRRTLRSILDDKEMRFELQRRAAHSELGGLWDVDSGTLASMLENPDPELAFESRPLSEAIVRAIARPVLMVENDQVTLPARSDVMSRRVRKHLKTFQPALRSVGRVELVGHPALEWVGTGWMIEEDVVVTNRHVASEFARRDATGVGYVFIRNHAGTDVLPRIDFREEYRSVVAAEFRIDRVLYIAPHSESAPDVAFLRVVRDNGAPLPPPIEPVATLSRHLRERRFMAVVGYPARDSRSDSRLVDRIFGDVYDVKRFAPGEVMTVPKESWFFEHDATTLGGNSGSVILDLQTGKALGLHYAGAHRKANYAVRIDTVLEMLHIAKGRTSVGGAPLYDELQEKTRPASSYKADGFDERFLSVRLPLPKPARRDDLLRVSDARDPWRLDYTHFSVRMSISRRLPMVTGANIDGSTRRKISRQGLAWYFDPRIPRESQVGKEFYGPTRFDRGHMVRREDPVWGEPEVAARANEDTFHYTNAAPQLPGLNQREWLELEDYVLDNADALDLKVSVFTGPVFGVNDPVIEGVQVPLRFWKVAALVEADTGELNCAAYLLSQEDMLAEAFHYGRFKTYQVSLAGLEDLTGISFGKVLRDADNYPRRTREEAVPSWSPGIEIRRPENVRFPRRGKT
ncbi:DNA/RNA non-specific endonuclease [Aquabacterium sp. A7-Y]|uniref:DNA/RNA non-specific endonuclease n=1 Tax=Aquabacterium sp. A7-Y TaxID=1349605 RepID=UPI00223CF914|nr:DNA/RNA non-specific endonuclease [Aquabacterium sp. A7-Y]MCW7539225.1 DNA/RNA non-specific endonuclease [Aquabacterium sp. A7-Y]